MTKRRCPALRASPHADNVPPKGIYAVAAQWAHWLCSRSETPEAEGSRLDRYGDSGDDHFGDGMPF
jgi:hypothetical protein